MRINHNLQTDTTLIFGKKGSGKTYLVKEILKKYQKYIVVDRLAEYPGRVVDNEISALDAVRKDPEHFKIIIRPQERRPKLFDYLYCIQNYLLVVEEISFFCNSHSLDTGLFNIMSYGRHRGIDFIGISQRPAQMHPLIRSQASIIYTFKMTEPLDIKYLKSYGLNNLDKLKKFKYIRKEV